MAPDCDAGQPQAPRDVHADGVHSYLTPHATGLRLCDYTPEKAQSLMDNERYFRFAVIRNPLERATSG
jgi:hypothetical protein